MVARPWAWCCRLLLLLALAAFGSGIATICQLYPIPMLLLAAFWRWRRMGRVVGSSWSHGSARWASFADLRRGGLLSDSGITLGTAEQVERPSKFKATMGLLNPLADSRQVCRAFFSAWFGSRWQADTFIRLKKFTHIATFAKTGAGKGVSLIVPNLLSYALSVVVIDIKGELFKLTGEHRRRRLKHRVFRLDPGGIAGPVAESATFNPLDFIDASSDDFLDQCRALAGDMVVKTGKETDEHWVDSARVVLTAFIAFVAGCETDRSKRNLNTVRQFVSSRIAFANAITIMQRHTEACQGVIARLGHMLTWYEDRELSSILSTVQRFTEFLDSPAMQRNVATSGFDPRLLRSGRASLYLCLPHDKVVSLAPLQRMWVSTLIRVLGCDGTGERSNVLFILDEAAHLGRIEAIENAITLLRGMGIRLWFAFQSLGQVKKVFGESAEIILDNIGTQQYFSVSSFESAEAISKRMGKMTIRVTSTNRNTSNSRSVGTSSPSGNAGNLSTGTSHTSNDTARELLRPEEILSLDPGTSLVFHDHLPVAAVQLIRYFDHPAFKRGRTGKPHGLGVAAGLLAATLWMFGQVFANTAASLPDQAAVRRMASAAADRHQLTPNGMRRSTPQPGFYRQQGGIYRPYR